jgi:hypothetical protein
MIVIKLKTCREFLVGRVEPLTGRSSTASIVSLPAAIGSQYWKIHSPFLPLSPGVGGVKILPGAICVKKIFQRWEIRKKEENIKNVDCNRINFML